VLTAMAPGRFAVALNQAPMRKSVGWIYLDWAANRRRVWNMPHPTPAHLLRAVCDEAASFDEAVARLTSEPISTPAIYSIAGIADFETAVIERTETEARVHRGAHVAANHWQAQGWTGHPRGSDSAGRAAMLAGIPADLETQFEWLHAPVLNPRTRIAMVADARQGRLTAQGYEDGKPATAILHLKA
jgi:hypothetical protein